MNRTKKYKALSLMEVLVTLVIIGILTLIAMPALMPLIANAKSTEAKIQLGHVLKLQKLYRYSNSKYSKELSAIGFEQGKLVDQDGNANYEISIESATLNSFTAKATAIVDFDGDGNFNVWMIDQDNKLEEILPD
ncbi:MAG: type IV pilin protein [Flavobacteriales bacterium]